MDCKKSLDATFPVWEGSVRHGLEISYDYFVRGSGTPPLAIICLLLFSQCADAVMLEGWYYPFFH